MPELLTWTMSESMVQLYSRFMFISMVHSATKGHMDDWILGLHLGPCPYQRYTDLSSLCCHLVVLVSSESGLLPRAISRSIALL